MSSPSSKPSPKPYAGPMLSKKNYIVVVGTIGDAVKKMKFSYRPSKAVVDAVVNARQKQPSLFDRVAVNLYVQFGFFGGVDEEGRQDSLLILVCFFN